MTNHSPTDFYKPTSVLVLVVEDEAIIAMELEFVLTEAGYDVLGPAATVTNALALIADRHPDAAVLDLNLGRERVTPVAKALKQLAIPFVIASASVVADHETLLSNVLNLGKPTSATLLLKEVDRMCRRTRVGLPS